MTQRATVRLPDWMDRGVDQLVEDEVYPNASEVHRAALVALLTAHGISETQRVRGEA